MDGQTEQYLSGPKVTAELKTADRNQYYHAKYVRGRLKIVGSPGTGDTTITDMLL